MNRSRSTSAVNGHTLHEMRWAIAALTDRKHRRTARHRDAARRLRARARWLWEPGVQGVGISRKERGDDRLQHLALTIYVEEKLPTGDIEHPVPRHVRIPGIERPVPTDVVAVGKLRAHAARPAQPGCGISGPSGTSGTLGCLVRRTADPESVYLLTAGHVLLSNGVIPGEEVLQPGVDYGGTAPRDVLASLSDWVNVTFSARGYPNVSDAAIAKIASPNDVVTSIRGVGHPRGRTDTLTRDQSVQFCGFASGFRTAAVRDPDFSTRIEVDTANGMGTAGFAGLVLCTPYASGGDSGAAVLDMDRRVVGIHLGGSDTVSFFSRIGYACDQLGIEVLTEDP